MILLPKGTLEWMLKVLLQLFYKSKWRNGNKTFLKPKFFSI